MEGTDTDTQHQQPLGLGFERVLFPFLVLIAGLALSVGVILAERLLKMKIYGAKFREEER